MRRFIFLAGLASLVLAAVLVLVARSSRSDQDANRGIDTSREATLAGSAPDSSAQASSGYAAATSPATLDDGQRYVVVPVEEGPARAVALRYLAFERSAGLTRQQAARMRSILYDAQENAYTLMRDVFEYAELETPTSRQKVPPSVDEWSEAEQKLETQLQSDVRNVLSAEQYELFRQKVGRWTSMATARPFRTQEQVDELTQDS